MAVNLVETGPKLDWTRDNRIHDHFSNWKEKAESYFDSILADCTPKQKLAYLKLWIGDEGIPLIRKWTNTDRLDFSQPETITDDKGRVLRKISDGYKLETWWNLLEEELKPKGNRILSIIEIFSQKVRQGNRSLNDWLTYVYNLAESCDYTDSTDRMIRDLLIVGCNSNKARNKIVRKGENITLNEVIEYLQIENSTHETLQEISRNNPTQQVHYTAYDSNSILASRIQILLILLPSFVSDVENPTAKNIKQNAKPETCTAMSVARKVMFRKYVRVLADSLKIHRNLILLIEAKLI